MPPAQSRVHEAIEAINLHMLHHHKHVEQLLERQALELPKILTQDLSKSLVEVVKQELEVLTEGLAQAEGTRLPREVRGEMGQGTLKEAEAVPAEPLRVAPPREVHVSPPTPAPPMMHPASEPVTVPNVVEEIPESPAASSKADSSKKLSASGERPSVSFHLSPPPPEAEEKATSEMDQSLPPQQVPKIDSRLSAMKEHNNSQRSSMGSTTESTTSGLRVGPNRSTLAQLDRSAIAGLREEVEETMRLQDRSAAQEDDSRWGPLRRAAKAVVSNTKFDVVLSVIILLNAVQIGFETDWNMKHAGEEQLPAFEYLDNTFSFFFLIELLLRLCKDQLYFLSWHHKSFGWNVLDTFLVVTSLIELVVQYQFQELAAGGGQTLSLSHLRTTRMVRLVRIMRVFKMVRFFSELRVMAYSVVMSINSLMWALLLLLLVMFVFGIAMMQLIEPYKAETLDNMDDKLEQFYGSLLKTIHTLFRSISGGLDWFDALSPLEAVSPIMEYIFSGYIFFTTFCCLNIVTGIFVENAKTLKDADERWMLEESARDQKKWIQVVADLFARLASDSGGVLSKEDFVDKLKDKWVVTCFKNLGIETETTTTDELWSLFDGNDWGEVDQEEFALGIKQFHGNARSIDLFRVRRDVRTLVKLLKPERPSVLD
eukprot:TRINITY_DN9074_c0_g1_i2.p1 TRINITY_DN9074_c0_g1~~TRINITY_DN9074_c0_g1_i2.p1  ORF type:complete len:654 (+),score=123.64 TRINITY_DN9074_c0_g1_i2:38-1999(+)